LTTTEYNMIFNRWNCCWIHWTFSCVCFQKI
jgi:hypothetical protein